MRCPAAKPIPSASSPESRKRTDSTRNGGQYSTTIRDEVKAELQIVANARPSAERPPVEAGDAGTSARGGVGGLDRGVELRRVAPCSRGPKDEPFEPPKGTWKSTPAVGRLTITIPAWLLRLKWVAYFSEVVQMPADSPNSVSLATASASS